MDCAGMLIISAMVLVWTSARAPIHMSESPVVMEILIGKKTPNAPNAAARSSKVLEKKTTTIRDTKPVVLLLTTTTATRRRTNKSLKDVDGFLLDVAQYIACTSFVHVCFVPHECVYCKQPNKSLITLEVMHSTTPSHTQGA